MPTIVLNDNCRIILTKFVTNYFQPAYILASSLIWTNIRPLWLRPHNISLIPPSTPTGYVVILHSLQVIELARSHLYKQTLSSVAIKVLNT